MEAERILEYEDAGEYVKEVINDKQRDSLRLSLLIANSCRIAFHANSSDYEAWVHRIKALLEKYSSEENDDNKTIWERLKNYNGSETLFERLKRNRA